MLQLQFLPGFDCYHYGFGVQCKQYHILSLSLLLRIALSGSAGFSCCIHRPLLMDAACLGEEKVLPVETILGRSRGVSVSRAGIAWCEWVPVLVLLQPCPSAWWYSRVCSTDGPLHPGPLGLLLLPRWEQGEESEPAGSGLPSHRHAEARKEHGSVT